MKIQNPDENTVTTHSSSKPNRSDRRSNDITRFDTIIHNLCFVVYSSLIPMIKYLHFQKKLDFRLLKEQGMLNENILNITY